MDADGKAPAGQDWPHIMRLTRAVPPWTLRTAATRSVYLCTMQHVRRDHAPPTSTSAVRSPWQPMTPSVNSALHRSAAWLLGWAAGTLGWEQQLRLAQHGRFLPWTRHERDAERIVGRGQDSERAGNMRVRFATPIKCDRRNRKNKDIWSASESGHWSFGRAAESVQQFCSKTLSSAFA